MNDESPFYCGETGNLRTRLKYHFSNQKDAIEYSTLKKCFYDPNDRTLIAMADMLYIKIIEVPFCRWDVEEFFHKNIISTQKKLEKNQKQRNKYFNFYDSNDFRRKQLKLLHY